MEEELRGRLYSEWPGNPFIIPISQEMYSITSFYKVQYSSERESG